MHKVVIIPWRIFCCLVTKSCLTLLQPHGPDPPRLLCLWDFPGKNTGVGCHFLLQRILLTRDQTLVSCIGRWFLYHWAVKNLSSYLIQNPFNINGKTDLQRSFSPGHLIYVITENLVSYPQIQYFFYCTMFSYPNWFYYFNPQSQSKNRNF